MKKGFLLSLDTMIAVSVLLLLAIFLAGISFTYYYPELKYQRLYLAGKDIMMVMEKIKIQDLQDLQTAQECLNKSILGQEDLNKTLLEIIGAFWATGNQTYQDYARNLTEEAFNQTLPEKLNYEILIGGTSIYRSGSNNASFLSRLSTIVSGYELGKPVSGWVARAWATKIRKNTTEVFPFPTEGAGNRGGKLEIWKKFYLNTTQIINGTLYVSVHYGRSADEFEQIVVNGDNVKNNIVWLHTEERGYGTGAFGVVNVKDNLVNGENEVYLRFKNKVYNAHVHPGMRLEVTYQTSEIKEANKTQKQRFYFDHIESGEIGNNGTGAWAMVPFYIPRNSTVKEVTFHLRAEEIEDHATKTDVRVYFNNTLYDQFDPPANGTVDKYYNFTDLATEGTNFVLVQLNYRVYTLFGVPIDDFFGDGDTIIYSQPITDPGNSSYIDVEYELPEGRLYYGYVDIGISENFGGPLENPKTHIADFENNTLENAFLHVAQLFSEYVSVDVWPEGESAQRIFQSPSARAVPSTIYIDPLYFNTSKLNYIKVEDYVCGDCYIIQESSLEHHIWVPSMVSYGEVNETEQGAIDDAAYRL
ncbi:MAG: hypothetical protein JSW41_00490, partial [Candidatus Aenigmatarchaeota archaeon]